MSDRLAQATSTEERQKIFEDDLTENPDQFDKDCREVAKHLNNNDREGLIEHGSRHIGEQAVARSEVIRSQFPLES